MTFKELNDDELFDYCQGQWTDDGKHRLYRLKVDDMPLDLFREMTYRGIDTGWMTLVFENGELAKIPTRQAILNSIIWESYREFDVEIKPGDIEDIRALVSNFISKQQTIMLPRIWNEGDVEHIDDIFDSFGMAINNMDEFLGENCGAYVETLNILDMWTILNDPKIKKVVDIKLDNRDGTKVAEKKINMANKELMRLISTRGELENNPLINFAETKSLSPAQIPQMLIAYGPRSDIDEFLFQHIIPCSSVTGMVSVEDYATESTSAKKSAYFNSEVIRLAQYFARELRLNNSTLHTMYKGDCGSTKMLKFFVRPEWAEALKDKEVYVNGKKITVGPNTYDLIKNQTVAFRSPVFCRHVDGVCEACASRGKDPWIWIVRGANLGMFTATQFAGKVSQKVLSAKHFNRTITILYILSQIADEYFNLKYGGIALDKGLAENVKDINLVVDFNGLNTIESLQELRFNVTPETFSKIHSVRLDIRGKEHYVEMASEDIVPYFSEHFLNFMSKKVNQIVLEDGIMTIPLKGYTNNKAMFDYSEMNDDMVSYVDRVRRFLKHRIDKYTSLERAFDDLAELVYSKTDLNIFFIEIILRAFIAVDTTEKFFDIEDPEDVKLMTIEDIVESNSVSSKLGHESVGTSSYLAKPGTFFKPKGGGPFDMQFNFKEKITIIGD